MLQKGPGARLTSEASLPLWNTHQNSYGIKKFTINANHPMIARLVDENDPAELLMFIENNLPMEDIYAYYAGNPPNADTENETNKEGIERIVEIMMSHWIESGNDREKIIVELKAIPSLAQNWEHVEILLREQYSIS